MPLKGVTTRPSTMSGSGLKPLPSNKKPVVVTLRAFHQSLSRGISEDKVTKGTDGKAVAKVMG